MRFACATTAQNRQVPLRVTRLWYRFCRHYRDALIVERYVMSKMDKCLFYRVTDVETTFIVLFVDDTLVFSKRQEDIDQFSADLADTIN